MKKPRVLAPKTGLYQEFLRKLPTENELRTLTRALKVGEALDAEQERTLEDALVAFGVYCNVFATQQHMGSHARRHFYPILAALLGGMSAEIRRHNLKNIPSDRAARDVDTLAD